MPRDENDKKGKSFFRNPFKKKSKDEEIQEELKWSGDSPLYEGSKRQEASTGYGDAKDYSDAAKDLKQGQETPVVSQRSSRSASTSSVEVDANELPSVPMDVDSKRTTGRTRSDSPNKLEMPVSQNYSNEADLEAARKANPSLFTSRTPSPRGGAQQEQYGTLPAAGKTQDGDASQLKNQPTGISPSTSPRGGVPQAQPKTPAPVQAEQYQAFPTGAAQTRGSQSEQYQEFPSGAAQARLEAEKAAAAKAATPRPLPTPPKKQENQYGVLPDGGFAARRKAELDAAAKNKDGHSK